MTASLFHCINICIKLKIFYCFINQRYWTQVICNIAFSYCPFDISWKDVFCSAFYFKWKYFVLVDHILSETICLLCFCVLFSNIYTKIKVTAKSWSDLCYFYSNVIFFTFLCWIWLIDILRQYCENFRKIEQVELVENLAQSYLPYRFRHDLASFLLWEKVKILYFFKKITRIKLFVHR